MDIIEWTTQYYQSLILECLHFPYLLIFPFQDGYVFHVQISYLKEISLLKMVTVDGLLKMVETEESVNLEQELVDLPKLASTLHR